MGQTGSKDSLSLVLPNGMTVSYDQEITVKQVLVLFPDHYITRVNKREPSKSKNKLNEGDVLLYGRTYAVHAHGLEKDTSKQWPQSTANAKTAKSGKVPKQTSSELKFFRLPFRKLSSDASPSSPFEEAKLTKSLTAPRPRVTPLVDWAAEDSDSTPTSARLSNGTFDDSSTDGCTPRGDGHAQMDWPASLEMYGWSPDSPAELPTPEKSGAAAAPAQDAERAQDPDMDYDNDDDEFKAFEKLLLQVQEGGPTGARHLGKWRPKLECIAEAGPHLSRPVQFEPALVRALTSRW